MNCTTHPLVLFPLILLLLARFCLFSHPGWSVQAGDICSTEWPRRILSKRRLWRRRRRRRTRGCRSRRRPSRWRPGREQIQASQHQRPLRRGWPPYQRPGHSDGGDALEVRFVYLFSEKSTRLQFFRLHFSLCGEDELFCPALEEELALFNPQACEKKKKIVFIKTVKTGGR